ncbi:hypothetical protein MICRO8M_70156 [Microbacterium sp. 8M]|uniref:hypothetical protein n=1 Tax=Microbacterium sp. 8M TaxID=2653153 RepID=UPI0012F270B1|nr:hypothetical protein [Microbacterium sp. 8M]VXB95901.1 hypothetical protein MICRO8M_70156 [Microbacterium sp. 8M]
MLAHAVDRSDALTDYTAARRTRTADVVRRSHRMGAMALLRNPAARALRDALIGAVGRLSADTAIRQLIPVVDWRPLTTAPQR